MGMQVGNEEVSKLYELASRLKQESESVAHIFHIIYGEEAEMEENECYIEIQQCIIKSIARVTECIGNSLFRGFLD